jgi:hypothetical protein
MQSTPSQIISVIFMLKLSSRVRLVLQSGVFLSMRSARPAHLILLNLIALITFGKACKLLHSSLCNLLEPPAVCYLLGTNIILSTLFSNILNLFSFRRVRDQVSQPFKTTGKIIVVYMFIFTFLDRKL